MIITTDVQQSIAEHQERYREREQWCERHIQKMRALGVPASWVGVNPSVPARFRAACAEAAQGGAKHSYEHVGFMLGTGIGHDSPHDIEDEQWAEEVSALSGLLDNDDDGGALMWLRFHLPNYLKLVPARRRHQLTAGLRRAQEEGGLTV